MQEVLVIGLNHKTAPLEVRERLSIPPAKGPDFLRLLEDRCVFRERLLLSTCNRTEIYGVGGGDESIRRVKELLCEVSRLELGAFEDKLYVLRQPDSVTHLFSVASGLDSMVVGETEILGQVKDAYQSAHQSRHTGKILNALFQRSLRVAKTVRTRTDIGAGRVSVASVAVELAEKIFERLAGVRVLVLGTGEMSSQVARAMVSRGAFSVIVSGRHHDRAEEIAHELGACSARYEELEAHAAGADVLIASTRAAHPIIDAARAAAWMKARQGKPLFLIDLAVPRNIDEAAGKIDNVYLFNLDDLRGITEKNRDLRHGQLETGFSMVCEHTRRFMNWLTKEFGPNAARTVSHP